MIKPLDLVQAKLFKHCWSMPALSAGNYLAIFLFAISRSLYGISLGLWSFIFVVGRTFAPSQLRSPRITRNIIEITLAALLHIILPPFYVVFVIMYV